MSRRFSREQIVRFLCEADAGCPVRELSDRHGFSVKSYQQWRAKHVGGGTSLAQRLVHLEVENAQLKRGFAVAVVEVGRASTKSACELSNGGRRSSMENLVDWGSFLTEVASELQVRRPDRGEAANRTWWIDLAQPSEWPELPKLPEVLGPQEAVATKSRIKKRLPRAVESLACDGDAQNRRCAVNDPVLEPAAVS